MAFINPLVIPGNNSALRSKGRTYCCSDVFLSDTERRNRVQPMLRELLHNTQNNPEYGRHLKIMLNDGQRWTIHRTVFSVLNAVRGTVNQCEQLLTSHTVKLFEHSTGKECCQLIPDSSAMRRLESRELEAMFILLFQAIQSNKKFAQVRGGVPVQLSHFDLHHGHFFYHEESQQFGILFHCAEYPKYHSQWMPYNLGFCQKGSDLYPNPKLLLTRNVVWLENSNHLLAINTEFAADVTYPGSLGTLYERDLGMLWMDVFFLAENDNTPGIFVYPYSV
mmetsp:Transcript_7988/g.14487  ORF Transcript_7988/g.14487 Transcript_7988/m.14487 type:complete len:278 (-) Transcript_7988:266-1099(-)|eukprot:CAMPEP_0182449404 /NCGR_PEP_ID=MMETSP1172-20130603/34095_1 /TAXON_ID=708627 /ORGANISM="Timspurckia oligopyrenoides, Strain CCMP3278" /LENGTH=277 /DNA_ID=CAMNT_0024646675 /DNA_START=583 /DNA_END=1416 /DNA_ORIENTATION=-